MTMSQNRRDFLGSMGAASAVLVTGAQLPRAMDLTSSTWDMSWLDKVATAKYRAVVDASVLEDGYAIDLANGLLGDYREVHGAGDNDVRIVVVARRLGTPLVFDDALWERYPVAENNKQRYAAKVETLQRRGVIFLVCNIAATNVARSLAEKTKRDAEEVRKDVFANFVPGTIVQPSGVFALMRAQNAGCAYMRGS
jgi:intracellular sulfur oxidation DsrE/DsrF family protein